MKRFALIFTPAILAVVGIWALSYAARGACFPPAPLIAAGFFWGQIVLIVSQAIRPKL